MRGPAIDSSGYDAGKKIKGKKRHILVDTPGLLMHAIVHAADVQDRDGGAADGELVRRLSVPDQALCRRRLPGAGVPERDQTDLARLNVEILKRSDQATGFVALPKRSAAADDWPRTGNASTTRRSPSSASPPSVSCCENYAILHDVPGQTLTIAPA